MGAPAVCRDPRWLRRSVGFRSGLFFQNTVRHKKRGRRRGGTTICARRACWRDESMTAYSVARSSVGLAPGLVVDGRIADFLRFNPDSRRLILQGISIVS